MSRGRLTDREIEEIQDRSRRAWNGLVARDEAEYREQLAGEAQPRPDLRVVGDSDDG